MYRRAITCIYTILILFIITIIYTYAFLFVLGNRFFLHFWASPEHFPRNAPNFSRCSYANFWRTLQTHPSMYRSRCGQAGNNLLEGSLKSTKGVVFCLFLTWCSLIFHHFPWFSMISFMFSIFREQQKQVKTQIKHPICFWGKKTGIVSSRSGLASAVPKAAEELNPMQLVPFRKIDLPLRWLRSKHLEQVGPNSWKFGCQTFGLQHTSTFYRIALDAAFLAQVHAGAETCFGQGLCRVCGTSKRRCDPPEVHCCCPMASLNGLIL